MRPDQSPGVSIILLTKNGERYLDEVLHQIFAQTTDVPFEVMAIDSASRDRTRAILQRYPVQVYSIPPEQFNHGATRNFGVQQAKGDLLVFLTQDATPADTQWLQYLIEPFARQPQLAAVTSRHLPRPDCNPIVAGHLAYILPIGADRAVLKQGLRPSDLDPDPAQFLTLSNTSAAYRGALLRQFPFATTDFAEDAWWELTILERGYATMFQPKSMVYHSHNLPLREQLRNSYDAKRTMKKIVAQLRCADGRLAYRPLRKNMFAALAAHNRYLQRKKITGMRRIYWLSYAICWYGAKSLGAMFGLCDEWLPRPIRHWLSRQVRLQHAPGRVANTDTA